MAKRRKRRLKSKLRFVIFCLMLAILFAGGFALANYVVWPYLAGLQNGDSAFPGNEKELAKMPGITVLMLGIDQRGKDNSERTDTMILANINNRDHRVSLLSIPRDTRVGIPGYGVNKINAANQLGGPELAMRVVEDLVGVPVDYYLLTNFEGFKNIVDTLGGVTIDVEKNMYHYDADMPGINLHKGLQRLDGDKALQYARFRGDELGDISRTQRQLKLLTAIGEEMMQTKTITKLPKLVPEIYRNLDTNIGLRQAVALAGAAKNLKNYQIVSQTLPGKFLDENGVSYWYVEPDDARLVVAGLFEEGKVVEVVQGSIDRNTSSGGNFSQVAMDEKRRVTREEPAPESETAGTNPVPPVTGGDQTGNQPPGGENGTVQPEPSTGGGTGGSTGEGTGGTPSPAQPEPEHHVEIIVNPGT